MANTCIDDNAFTLRFDDKRMDTHNQFSLLIGKRRVEPIALFLDVLSRCVGKEKIAVPRSFRFDDSRNLHVTDIPLIHLLSSFSLGASLRLHPKDNAYRDRSDGGKRKRASLSWEAIVIAAEGLCSRITAHLRRTIASSKC